jgi:hypothetical protein
VIVGAAFVPETPLLVPEVAQGAAAEIADLGAACRAAIGRVAERAESWLVIGSAEKTTSYDAGTVGTLAGFGVDLEVALGDGPANRSPVLPPSLTVGAWLLRQSLGKGMRVSAFAAGPRSSPPPVPDHATAMLVVGDGSASRSEKAPGYFDERAAQFDADVADALRSGVGERLRSRPTAGLADERLCG